MKVAEDSFERYSLLGENCVMYCKYYAWVYPHYSKENEENEIKF